jgi:hypothetical protein
MVAGRTPSIWRDPPQPGPGILPGVQKRSLFHTPENEASHRSYPFRRLARNNVIELYHGSCLFCRTLRPVFYVPGIGFIEPIRARLRETRKSPGRMRGIFAYAARIFMR